MPMSADMKKINYSNNMRTNRNELMRQLLSGVTKDELEYLVRMREEARRPIHSGQMGGGEARRRIPTSRRMTQYRPILASRTKKQRPVPAPRTRNNEKRGPLKGFTKSFQILLKSDRDPLVELQNTRLVISRLLSQILTDTRGFKFVETLVVTFNKKKDDKIIYSDPIYFNSRPQTVINPNDFLPSLELSQQKLLNGIGVWLSEGSGWTIRSIDKHYINIVAYNPLAGNSYIPPPTELRNPKKV